MFWLGMLIGGSIGTVICCLCLINNNSSEYRREITRLNSRIVDLEDKNQELILEKLCK